MQDKELTDNILEQRKNAIDASDRKNLDNFLNKPKSQSKTPLVIALIILIFIIFVLSLFTVDYFELGEKENPPQQNKIIYQTTNNYKYDSDSTNYNYNINKSIELICLSEPNSTEMKCYK